MKWRTDKPTADVIVAKLTEAFTYNSAAYDCIFKETEPYDHYRDYGGEEIPYGAIEKWADLEEDETVTENNSLKEEINSYFQGYWPGTETEEQCNTDMHFTPLAIMRLAEHFAKWGEEKAYKATMKEADKAKDKRYNMDYDIKIQGLPSLDGWEQVLLGQEIHDYINKMMPDTMNAVATYFAKWGAEHLKK